MHCRTVHSEDKSRPIIKVMINTVIINFINPSSEKFAFVHLWPPGYKVRK